MSKAPKQRKVQLHYQPYQPAGGASNASDSSSTGLLSGGSNGSASSGGNSNGTGGGQSQSGGAALDYGLSDLMDPVLAGYSSNLSRNLWDDWNENDPSLMKFDMFSDDGMASTSASSAAHTSATTVNSSGASTSSTTSNMGFMASMMTPHQNQQHQNQQLQLQLQQQQQQQHILNQQQQQQHGNDPMDLDAPREAIANGFHSLSSQPRLSVKRSLSEDLVSMLDEDDGHDHDPFGTTNGSANKSVLPRGFSFAQQFNANSNASPLAQKPQPPQPQLAQHAMHPRSQLQFQQQQQQQQQQGQHGQHLLVQHATDWLNGFPAANMPPHMQQQAHQQQQQQPPLRQPTPQPPLSPTSAARLEAHIQRPEPTPMERASAAIASTLVAIPNPCKESAPSAVSTPTTPAVAANAITPSPFSAYSFMNAAMENAKVPVAGDSTSEGDKMAAHQNPNPNPFANAGMMMPGFMMYSMPMMGNYQAAAAAAAAMGMMPMGAMQMGPMGMPMGGMQMNPMGMPMGIPSMGGMQMGMPMMQMAAASMGMPLAAMGGAGTVPLGAPSLNAADTGANDSAGKVAAPKALQPKGPSVLAPAGAAGGTANNASFVSIARKPDEPEVSNILKSLMEEEAKKKEKKLERNRDSARESRKKQQTYVESLENGIKRLQINRDLVVSYRWGVTGGPSGPSGHSSFEWTERVSIVTGRSESFSTLQNPTNFQNLMRINRQRRALSLSREAKERALYKCFVAIGKQLAGLRVRLLELQVFRNVSNPASAAGQELRRVLQLSAEQQLQLECHSNRVFDQQVLAMVKLFKVFFALRAQALALNLLSPELERFFRDVCSMDQLQKLLQWTELHRTMIEGDSVAKGSGSKANVLALSLVS